MLEGQATAAAPNASKAPVQLNRIQINDSVAYSDAPVLSCRIQ